MKNLITEKIRSLLGFNILEERSKVNLEETQMTLGKILFNQQKDVTHINTLKDVEFKIFSQWGDDGIINWIFNKLNIFEESFFIEFGVQHYTESNTRYMLKSRNCSGVVLDGNLEYINYIKNDSIYWMHDLKAAHHFITKENINDLLKLYSKSQDVDLLSIDIDGNDYWIFSEIKSISPKIIICEYNGLLGNELSLTIPYKADFYRSSAHHSNLYFGASIKALINLATEKNYTFLGTNSNANNAYFVRNDLAHKILPYIKETKIYTSKFRESRTSEGKLSYLSRKEGLNLISEMVFVDLENNQTQTIKDLFKIN